MKEETGQNQTANTQVKTSEVTSAMIQNAHASGDGSIKRSEEENIGEEKETENKNESEYDEGII